MQEEGLIFHFEVPQSVPIVLYFSITYDCTLQTTAVNDRAQKSL